MDPNFISVRQQVNQLLDIGFVSLKEKQKSSWPLKDDHFQGIFGSQFPFKLCVLFWQLNNFNGKSTSFDREAKNHR